MIKSGELISKHENNSVLLRRMQQKHSVQSVRTKIAVVQGHFEI